MNEHARATIAAFGALFGREPVWGARAPGRVNLIGEHTDYNDGLVLPCAIDRDCVALAAPGNRGHRIHSVELNSPAELGDDFEFCGQPAAWADYVRGVLALFPGDLPPLDILVSSEVPIGAGLSSSAALEVAAATLLCQVGELKLESVDLARLCQQAEHRYAGVPCGLMDQLASVCGKKGHALLIDCRDHRVTSVPLDEESLSILVVDTMETHALADGEYARRRANCEAAARLLGVASLSELHVESLLPEARTDDPEMRAQVIHVLDENRRVRDFVAALQDGAHARAGELLHESHASLRDLFRVSTERLDFLVEACAALGEQGGVHGARLTGGGFGGAVIVLGKKGREEEVGRELAARFAAKFGCEPTILPVRASEGAGPIQLSSA